MACERNKGFCHADVMGIPKLTEICRLTCFRLGVFFLLIFFFLLHLFFAHVKLKVTIDVKQKEPRNSLTRTFDFRASVWIRLIRLGLLADSVFASSLYLSLGDVPLSKFVLSTTPACIA